VFDSVSTQLKQNEDNVIQYQHIGHLVAVYYNRWKPNLLRNHVDVTLADLKHQLSQLNIRLHFPDQRRVTDVEYHRLSVCS
jgi:cell division FtsZ-interacting protein ZapD